MALSETAKLLVNLSLIGNFKSEMGKAGKAAQNFDKDASRAFKAGTQIGVGIKRGAVLAAAGVGALATQVGFGLDQLIELEKLTTQTNATLKSTRGVSGQTAASIRALAEKYEGLNATIDDKVIQSGENLLLTFTNVRKKAFEPALLAALDMSTALGKDLNQSIVTVGKALSDPAKAVGRLTKAGIILTKSEQKQIEAHLKNNDTLGAQDVILKALNKRYGGSFLAGGTTTEAKVKKFGDAIEDLQKSLATALLPTVSNIADALTTLLQDPEIIDGTKRLGEDIGALFSPANIKAGVGAIKEGAGVLLEVAGAVGGVVKTAVGLFTSLPPELQKLAVGAFAVNKLTGGLVTNLAGGLIGAVLSSFKGLMHVNAAAVSVNGPVTGLPGGGTAGGGGLLAGITAPAILASIAAVVSKEVADNLNTGAALKGIKVNFEAPGGGPFGITSLVHNLQELIGALNQRPIATEGSLDRPGTVGPAADALRQKQQEANDRLLDIGHKIDLWGTKTAAAVSAVGTKITSAVQSKPKFTPTVKLDPSQIIDLRFGRDKSTTDVETKRGNVFGPGGLGQSITDAQKAAAEKVTTSVETMRGKIADELQTAQTGIDRTRAQVGTSGAAVAAAERVGASSIVSAIYANRPVITTNVNVSATTVDRTTTVVKRYGATGGSRYVDGGNIREGAD